MHLILQCTLGQEQKREQEQECRGMSCVPLSQHWSSITAPLLVVGSQLDVAQYTSCPLTLGRGGVVALAMLACSRTMPSSPSSSPTSPAGGPWREDVGVCGDPPTPTPPTHQLLHLPPPSSHRTTTPSAPAPPHLIITPF